MTYTHAEIPAVDSPAEKSPAEPLEQLRVTVVAVVDFYRALRHSDDLDGAGFSVSSAWTARDALVHIVFWHESFARNVGDLAGGRTPRPLRGTYAQLSARATEENRGATIEELLGRLASAQSTIEQSVYSPQVALIPYRVGSRPYLAVEHVAVVNEHVSGHLKKVEAASRGVVTTRKRGGNAVPGHSA